MPSATLGIPTVAERYVVLIAVFTGLIAMPENNAHTCKMQNALQ